ncbi:MAG: ParA family protein [Pseudonocardia sp.]
MGTQSATKQMGMMTAQTRNKKESSMAKQDDPQLSALRRVVLIANQKGGVGKTSITTALGSLVADGSHRVLIVDADPQGNATGSDLGVVGDRGRSLMMALQYGEPLQVQSDVRPGLDLVCGGPFLAQVGALTATASQTGLDLVANLRKTLAQACTAGGYTLVLIDSGPGDAPLLDALLRTARYLIVPTRDDDASLEGVELLARRYLMAKERDGAILQLLGVVLFDANPRATARNGQVLEDLDSMLEGSGASCFKTMIRSDRAAALDLRAAHLTPVELVDATANASKARLARLSRAGRHRADADEVEQRLWSRDPVPLASDYQSLARELLGRVATHERTSA